LLPGVAASRDLALSNSNGVDFTVNGLRGRSNDQQIDGQNNNDNSVGGPSIFGADAEFFGSYQATTNNFGPEYGRNSGSVINLNTKSGTNTWHGSVYGAEGNSILNTLDPTQKTFQQLTKVPHFNDAFVGATIGGPLVKNKVFLFAGDDVEANESSTIDSSGNLTPTPAGIAAMSACYTNPVSQAAVSALTQFGPYGVGGGSPTPIPGSLQSVALGSPDVANDPSGNCIVQMGGVQRTLSNSLHQYDWVTRLDVTGAKDTFYSRYLFQKQSFFNQDSFLTAAAGYPNNVPSTGQQIALDWTHQISNRMVNDLRATYGRTRVEFGGNTIGNTIPRMGGLEDALANVTFLSPGLLGYGPATTAPQGRIVNTYQLQDNWSYVFGKHQLKAGGNFTYQRSPNRFLPNANGQFQFADWTAYALNQPSSTLVTLGNPTLDFREHDTFVYFGDDLKVTKNLTLNLGVTWSYYGQPANLFHQNDLKQTSFWDPALPQSVTVFPSIPAPKNSWGPGIGFAYSPDFLGQGKTVIRGGYRLSYDPPYYNIYLNIASAAPQVLAQTISPGVGIIAVPTGPNVRSALSSSLTLGVADPRQFSQTTVSPNFGPDRIHEWSFGVQREMGSHAAAEVRYVGNHANNLFQSVNQNPYLGCGDPGCVNPITGGGENPGLADAIAAGEFPSDIIPSGLTPCPAAQASVTRATGRVNCNAGRVRERTNTAYSDYNGVQAELRTNNLFHQLTLRTNYTFSKTTDNASEIFGTFAGGGTYAFSQDPFNFRSAEHGLSGQDFPNTWTVSFNEDLPAFRAQHGIVGHILGGWSVAGSYIIQSGQTFTPVQAVLNSFTNPADFFDAGFDASFNSGLETARPFVSNPAAPANTIGITAADTCTIFGGAACSAPSGTLYDLAPLFNGNGAENPVDGSSVHFIANGAGSQAIFRTPFGTAGRNSLRGGRTNTANFQVSKTIKWGERASIVWHMSMINALNHPNFGYTQSGCITCLTIDPFIEDVGAQAQGTGFADPKVMDGGHRSIRFGIKVAF
jgi:hypothetical protein